MTRSLPAILATLTALLALQSSPAWANDVDIRYDPPSAWQLEADPPDVVVSARVCTAGCTGADLFRDGEFVFRVGWDDALVPNYVTYCYSIEPGPPWEQWADDDDGVDDDDVDDDDDHPGNMAEYCAQEPWDCRDCNEDGVAECWGSCGKRGRIEMVDPCVPVEQGGEADFDYRAEADTGRGSWENEWEVTVAWVDPCQTPAAEGDDDDGDDDDDDDAPGGGSETSCVGCPASIGPVKRVAPLGLRMLTIGLVGLALGRRQDARRGGAG
jgi:hypothetical protein